MSGVLLTGQWPLTVNAVGSAKVDILDSASLARLGGNVESGEDALLSLLSFALSLLDCILDMVDFWSECQWHIAGDGSARSCGG